MVIASICSIAFFNYSGISISGKFGPATRTIVDTLRTIIIWMYSLAAGWEQFSYWQVIGFVFLLAGTFIYKDLFIAPYLREIGWLKSTRGDRDFEIESGSTRPLIAVPKKK